MSRRAPQDVAGVLDWVGMAGIQVPVLFDAGDGEVQRASARVAAFVNLPRAQQRGIHTSRLYLRVAEALVQAALSVDSLRTPLHSVLDSQRRTANRAHQGAISSNWYVVRHGALRTTAGARVR